jgi:hypothetical protein
MQYMLLIYLDENTPSQAQREECYRDSSEYARELAANGKCLASTPLYPTSTATSIRMREGKRLVTDGPFAETREQLGGYYLVNADDLDEAIAMAFRIPAGRWGTVEIRPVIEIPGLDELSSLRPVDLAQTHSTP